MNCRILSTLFVRSNGEICCEDDTGAGISLSRVYLSEFWSICDVFNNDKYWHIRKSLAKMVSPWKDICINCALFNSGEQLVDNLKNKQIKMIHIETSLNCNLLCPLCVSLYERNHRPGPLLMDLKVFERVLTSCSENDFTVELIDFGGNGEPLSNPIFSDFVRLARSIMPETKLVLVTNGNYDYKNSLKDQFLDVVMVSCDGLYQNNYEKYRIHGSVSQALQFMADAKSSKQLRQPYVVWKYILFEFNDSYEELVRAQEKAMELGVDEIKFIITHTKYRSKRFSIENTQEIPLILPIANVTSTEKLKRINKIGKPLNSNDSRVTRFLENTYCVIDKIYVSDYFVTVQGWAMGKGGQNMEGISVYCDDQLIGEANLGLSRPDVLSAYPELKNDKSGFTLTKRIFNPLNSPRKIMLELITDKGIIEKFPVLYVFE